MEGIKGAVALMLLGLLGFFVYGTMLQSTLQDKHDLVTVKSNQYTKALLLKAKVETLEKQKALKFAALAAWDKVSTGLPAEMKFTRMRFESSRAVDGSTGRKLLITGAADAGKATLVDDYQQALARMESGEGEALFTGVRAESIRQDLKRNQTYWQLKCEFDGE